MDKKYLDQMRAHLEEGGKLTHKNAADLLEEINKLRVALEAFNPHRIGFGQSLSHDKLGAAWKNANELLRDKPAPQLAPSREGSRNCANAEGGRNGSIASGGDIEYCTCDRCF